MKPVAAIQLRTSKAKSWGAPAPQFPSKRQVPQGRVVLKEALRRSKARAARKSWLVFSIAELNHFYRKGIYSRISF